MALEKKHWLKLKRKSPKVPDITCPIIDDIIARLEKHQDKNKVISQYQHDVIVRRLERLRAGCLLTPVHSRINSTKNI